MIKQLYFFIALGIYIFLEASQRSPGDRARLISDWLAPNRSACLQFWYHMHGTHLGALNIILKTNESERLVWHQEMKDYGDMWILGQAPIHSNAAFKASKGNSLMNST